MFEKYLLSIAIVWLLQKINNNDQPNWNEAISKAE